jgi:hypothetical protein
MVSVRGPGGLAFSPALTEEIERPCSPSATPVKGTVVVQTIRKEAKGMPRQDEGEG